MAITNDRLNRAFAPQQSAFAPASRASASPELSSPADSFEDAPTDALGLQASAQNGLLGAFATSNLSAGGFKARMRTLSKTPGGGGD
jgi:hypothetical protein